MAEVDGVGREFDAISIGADRIPALLAYEAPSVLSFRSSPRSRGYGDMHQSRQTSPNGSSLSEDAAVNRSQAPVQFLRSKAIAHCGDARGPRDAGVIEVHLDLGRPATTRVSPLPTGS
jgi:hypothetical protein